MQLGDASNAIGRFIVASKCQGAKGACTSTLESLQLVHKAQPSPSCAQGSRASIEPSDAAHIGHPLITALKAVWCGSAPSGMIPRAVVFHFGRQSGRTPNDEIDKAVHTRTTNAQTPFSGNGPQTAKPRSCALYTQGCPPIDRMSAPILRCFSTCLSRGQDCRSILPCLSSVPSLKVGQRTQGRKFGHVKGIRTRHFRLRDQSPRLKQSVLVSQVGQRRPHS